ncbi:MAG: hypothetical protein IT449_04270 [Phycisphaerales bacterium]|nr:hypothetical protein [Phycisphaerales bacterium]
MNARLRSVFVLMVACLVTIGLIGCKPKPPTPTGGGGDTAKNTGGGESKAQPPKTEPPKTEPPKTEPPKTEPPKTEPPKPQPPKPEPPKTEPPKTEPPKTEPPKTEPPKPEPPKPQPPKTEPPKPEPPKPEPPKPAPPTPPTGENQPAGGNDNTSASAWLFNVSDWKKNPLFAARPGDNRATRLRERRYTNGNLCEQQEVWEAPAGDLIQHGTTVRWFETGILAEEWTFTEGTPDGPMVQYHPNGQRRMFATWSHGKLNGVMISWDEDGRVVRRAEYKEGELITTG